VTAGRYHEPVRRIREGSGGALPTGTSLRGAGIPVEAGLHESDFLPLHGNRDCGPDEIRRMVHECSGAAACRGRPIPFDADDHFDFDRNDNHFPAAAGEHAARGVSTAGCPARVTTTASGRSPSTGVRSPIRSAASFARCPVHGARPGRDNRLPCPRQPA